MLPEAKRPWAGGSHRLRAAALRIRAAWGMSLTTSADHGLIIGVGRGCVKRKGDGKGEGEGEGRLDRPRKVIQPCLKKSSRSHLCRNRRSLGIDRLDSHHLAILVALASKHEARIRAQKEPGLSPAGHRQRREYPLGSLMDLRQVHQATQGEGKRRGHITNVALGSKKHRTS